MKEPPRPDNEDDRLRALRQLLILDTPPEERFNRLTAFAASEFDMPIALLSLIDKDRQWFKARHGLDVCETGRDISFCGHAILQDEPLVVPDAAADDPHRVVAYLECKDEIVYVLWVAGSTSVREFDSLPDALDAIAARLADRVS